MPRLEKPLRFVLILSALASLLLGLAACGSGEKIVATVGKTKVSQATLSHWMDVMAAGDYKEMLVARIPDGMVSDPPDFARCVRAAQQIVPQAAGQPGLSAGQLRGKCRELYAVVKEQALSYVLSVIWAKEEGAEYGIRPSQAEISRRVRELALHDYKSPAQFNKAMADMHRTPADERFAVQRNLLETKFLARLKKHADQLGGGFRTEGKLVLENNAKWNARTSCSPGYNAWECKQYRAPGQNVPSPDLLLEQFHNGQG